MKTQITGKKGTSANALVVTMVLTATALLTLAGVMAWSGGGARVSARSSQYARTVSAAEAATEKAAGQMMQDFLTGSESLVTLNMSNYITSVPSSSDSSYWTNWQFSDTRGNYGKNYIQRLSTTNYSVLSAPYAGLYGYISSYDVVSDASEISDLQAVTAGNLQEIQLTTVPLFQFAMYTSSDMEIEPGAAMYVYGAVHSNGNLYADPSTLLDFKCGVSVVGTASFSRNPLEGRGSVYTGSVVYEQGCISNSSPLTLPIGTTNTPTAVRAIIQPPALGESPSSSIGLSRYYNKVDMIVNVSPAGVSATSGRFNSFMTIIPASDLAKFVTTTNLFHDARENKDVYPVDINVGKLTAWSATNASLRPALGYRDVSSVYVCDTRIPAANTLEATRLVNGQSLPSLGLTVATADPLYVQGHFNQTNSSYLGTSNTATVKPASLVGDALTILSTAWADSNSFATNLSSRVASSTTVNAAILAGSVYTTSGHYSGGMENFMRLLEDWSSATLTYNGSMVAMFPSQYATNCWPNTGYVYQPPGRNFYFDLNFNDPSKLPPLTPSLLTVSRSKWSTLAANVVTASTNAF